MPQTWVEALGESLSDSEFSYTKSPDNDIYYIDIETVDAKIKFILYATEKTINEDGFIVVESTIEDLDISNIPKTAILKVLNDFNQRVPIGYFHVDPSVDLCFKIGQRLSVKKNIDVSDIKFYTSFSAYSWRNLFEYSDFQKLTNKI